MYILDLRLKIKDKIMNKDELVKLQHTQYEILKNVVKICNDNKIEYFVAYGTLLGTVRHHGTIPWDNDIDIMMLRDEYLKFEKCAEQLPDNLNLSLLYTNNVNVAGEARVSNINTLQYGLKHDSRKGNVCIDIFIFDNAKVYSKIIKIFIDMITYFVRLSLLDDFEIEWLFDLHKNNKKNLFIIKLAHFLGRFKSTDKKLALIKKLHVSDSKNSMYFTSCSDLTNAIFNKEWFKESINMKYEDLDVSVPVGYDEVLKAKYGDYMQFPPEEKRFTSILSDFTVEYL